MLSSLYTVRALFTEISSWKHHGKYEKWHTYHISEWHMIKKTAQTFTNSAITFILHLTRTTAGLAEKRNTCSFLVSLKSLLLLSFVICIISQLSHEDDVRVANVSVSRGAKMTTGTMKETFYIAPEVIKSGFYNSKADIYSFGIMLWEMWYGKRALKM